MAEPRAERAAKGLWWDKGWTLVEGCTPCSAGCRDCWARALEKRTGRAVEGGGIRLRWDRLEDPLHWRKPRVVAVWNDLFHKDVPLAFLNATMRTIADTPQHTYIILTKRAGSMRYWCPSLPRNVILGVTCESNEYLARVGKLVQTPAACRFVNAHLLGPLNLIGYGHRLDWIAVEANRPCRCDPTDWWQWCSDLLCDAMSAGVPVWVKQGPRANGRVTHDLAEFPEWARRREFPTAEGD